VTFAATVAVGGIAAAEAERPCAMMLAGMADVDCMVAEKIAD
jgi:hypothetical protein